MAGVARRVGQAVHHDVEQRHLLVPPRHVAPGIERELVDGGVRVAPDAVVQADDVGAALVLRRPRSVPAAVASSHRGRGSGNGRSNTSPKYRASQVALCLTSPSRFVPVTVNGRRTSYSDSPSSFQTRASRTHRKWSWRWAFATSSITAASLPPGHSTPPVRPHGGGSGARTSRARNGPNAAPGHHPRTKRSTARSSADPGATAAPDSRRRRVGQARTGVPNVMPG